MVNFHKNEGIQVISIRFKKKKERNRLLPTFRKPLLFFEGRERVLEGVIEGCFEEGNVWTESWGKAGILADEDEAWKRDIAERWAGEQHLPCALQEWQPADPLNSLMHKEYASFQA